VSSFNDPDYMLSLEKSISDTNKLNRFNKYRTRYAESLGELSSGKINEEEYLSALTSQLNGIDYPELRLEIQGDITAAQAKVKTYKDTILANQVKKAKYDGTRATLTDAISRVNTARAEALINDNEDEVTTYDETLSALNSQLSGVKIQDSITDFQVRSSTRGTNPVEKLDYINSQIKDADSNIAVKIGDRTYTSVQQFWSLERDNFLAGSSDVFGNFFDELSKYTKDAVDADTTRFGYPTGAVLDSTFATFNGLRTKPEMTPFLNRLDSAQTTVMGAAVDKYAEQLVTVSQGTTDFSFKEADLNMQNATLKYGVDLTARRVQLQNLSLSNENIPESAVPELNLSLPGVKKPETPGAAPTPTPLPTTGSMTVRAGDTLSKIASESGIGLAQLLELNPQFKDNPNLIQTGQVVKLPNKPAETPTPTPTPTPAKPETPAATTTPTTAVPAATTTPPVSTPAPTTIETPPTSSKTYVVKSGDTLSGIALKLYGDAKRFKELATENGIVDPNKIKVGATIKYNQ